MNDHSSYKRVLIFHRAIRAFHWLRVLCMIMLIITGFYIAYPYLVKGATSTDVLLQGWIRLIHIIFGFVLTAVTLSRAYMHFFGKVGNIERRSQKDLFSLNSWKQELQAYFFKGKLEKVGAYEPLQYLSYFVVSLMAGCICITGLTLYANVYHHGVAALLATPASWVTYALGGLAMVRLIHHYIVWVFIIFVFFHVYLAAWSGIRFRHAAFDAIISGHDYRHRPDKKS